MSTTIEGRELAAAVMLLTALVEAKDSYTVSHSRNVSTLAVELAKRMDLDGEEIERIRLAGLLHDIGKVTVPGHILKKPGALTAAEFVEVKKHPEMGCRVLQLAGDIFTPIMAMVKHHHERWDGCGYPEGLTGEEIPLGAAILAVADAIDAMISNRSYRAARTAAEVREEMRICSGAQFHPGVIRVLLSDFEEILAYLYAASAHNPAELAVSKNQDPASVPQQQQIMAQAGARIGKA